MLVLEFDIPKADSVLYGSWSKALNVESVKEADLHYKLFYGHVEFSVDGVTFVSRGSFVTLVDLALGLLSVARSLRDGSDGVLGFTESDKTIKFQHQGDLVTLASSSHANSASLGRGELLNAIKEFSRRVYESVASFNPRLSDNETVKRLRVSDGSF